MPSNSLTKPGFCTMALKQEDVMLTPPKPITERSNTKSKNIDTATTQEMIDTLHDCEAELFKGWQNHKKIFDRQVLGVMSDVSRQVAKFLQDPLRSTILMSGCGTSGRLAFFLASKMNHVSRRMGLTPCFDYIVAGGHKALTHSVEAYEDRPEMGRRDLIQVAKEKDRVLFIGITCGLSAPYVAGQLNHCISQPDVFTPVLVGFNPTNLARNQAIDDWDQTFFSVTMMLQDLEKNGKGFILNPVLGPEAITGSSRLKGGGATKLLLESCFLSAISSVCLSSKPPHGSNRHVYPIPSTTASCHHASPREESILDASDIPSTLISVLMESYCEVWEDSHRASKPTLSHITQTAGESLIAGNHIFYVGTETWGILGLIDASECPPTFGSDFDDIRGFVFGGLMPICSVQQIPDDHQLHDGKGDETSVQFFITAVLPSIQQRDTVIFLLPRRDEKLMQQIVSLVPRVSQKTNQVFGLLGIEAAEQVAELGLGIHTLVALPPPAARIGERIVAAGMDRRVAEEALRCIAEFAAKSSLNAISTGAHIMKGKVFQNSMIDLRLSNSKLLERGVYIVEKLAQCRHESAWDAVRRAILQSDEESVSTIPVSSLIQSAGSVEKVVPVALVLAIKQCRVREAQEILQQTPVIRTALSQLLSQHALGEP